jgi:hypothetical protein
MSKEGKLEASSLANFRIGREKLIAESNVIPTPDAMRAERTKHRKLQIITNDTDALFTAAKRVVVCEIRRAHSAFKTHTILPVSWFYRDALEKCLTRDDHYTPPFSFWNRNELDIQHVIDYVRDELRAISPDYTITVDDEKGKVKVEWK